MEKGPETKRVSGPFSRLNYLNSDGKIGSAMDANGE